MHVRRKASFRVKGAGVQYEECYEEEEDAGGIYGEQQDGAAGGISDADANINNNTENQQPLNAAIVPPYCGPFTKTFPVTLIDSAGQPWSVKYVTTRRDNLHSGRLARRVGQVLQGQQAESGGLGRVYKVGSARAEFHQGTFCGYFVRSLPAVRAHDAVADVPGLGSAAASLSLAGASWSSSSGGGGGGQGDKVPSDSTLSSGLLPLISVHYGGQCVIDDPGCYLCLKAEDPAAGCAQCASGFKLATKPLKGRRAALSNSFTVPYCVGSVLKGAVEKEVVNTFGQLQPAVNTVSEAKLNALRNIANEFNSTLYNAKNALSGL